MEPGAIHIPGWAFHLIAALCATGLSGAIGLVWGLMKKSIHHGRQLDELGKDLERVALAMRQVSRKLERHERSIVTLCAHLDLTPTPRERGDLTGPIIRVLDEPGDNGDDT